MRHRHAQNVVIALAFAAGLGPAPAQAETLLIERVEAGKSLETPVRGQLMAAVEARYGAPMQRLEPRGGQKPQWPVIRRWVYPGFTVYFEHDQVIDVVVNKATPLESGPKPVE
jgi:hypothetical protein